MSANDLHLSSADAHVPACRAEPSTPTSNVIDWHGLQFADRACRCTAKPAVIVVMPPAPGPPHPTELLLCGHHYRASQVVLAVSGAKVFSVTGAALRPADLWRVGAGTSLGRSEGVGRGAAPCRFAPRGRGESGGVGGQWLP